MIFSCYGCEKRHAACHATCETYKKEKEEHEAKKAQELEKKMVERRLNDHMFDTMSKSRKHNGRKWNGKEGRNVE